MWKRTCILSDSQQRVSSIFLGGKHYELINFYHCILWIIARIRKMKTNSLIYSDVSYISILDYGRELQGLICKAHRVGLSMQVAADGYLPSRRHNFAMGLASMHIAQLLDVSYLKGKNVQMNVNNSHLTYLLCFLSFCPYENLWQNSTMN